jgi:hypothetical protein
VAYTTVVKIVHLRITTRIINIVDTILKETFEELRFVHSFWLIVLDECLTHYFAIDLDHHWLRLHRLINLEQHYQIEISV